MTLDQLGRFPALQAPELAALVRKHWGVTRGATREERLAEVRRLNNDLRAAAGDPARGRQLFHDRCATCHRLQRRGRDDRPRPDLRQSPGPRFPARQPRRSRRSRPQGVSGVQSSRPRTAAILSGLIVEQTPDAITLRDAKGERTRVARSEVEELKESDASLMPESLYKEFSPEQLRDLFSFLQR